MTCNVQDILLYVEGELSPDEAARLRAHTAQCASCRERLLAEQALLSALGGMKDLEPPSDFAEATVRRAECDVRHTLRSPRERRHAVTIATLLATLALLLLWPTGVYAYVATSLAPVRCIAKFALGWTGSTALSVFIVSRTVSKGLLEASSVPLGAALLILCGILALLIWLIAGYRQTGSASGERETTQ